MPAVRPSRDSSAPLVLGPFADAPADKRRDRAIHPHQTGVWSTVPVFQGLRPSFLREPQIPRAPLAPRLEVDNPACSAVRLVNAGRSAPQLEPQPEPSPEPPQRPKPFVSTVTYLFVSAGIGSIIGVAMAWLFGVL